VIGYDAAFAGTSCLQQDTLNWGSYGAGTANPTPVTYTAVGSYPAVTVTMTVAAVNNPGPGNNTPQIINGTFGGFTGNFYKLSMTNSSNTQGYDVTFSWTRTIYNLRFTLVDIDRFSGTGGNGFQDRVWLTGPSTWTSTRGSEIGGTAGTAADPWVGTGTTDVGANSPNGNVNVTVNPAAGLNSVAIHYRAGNLLNDVQSIGILKLTWCR
jgi:hypothetical protein